MQRRFSSVVGGTATGADDAKNLTIFAALIKQLDSIAPRFEVDADQVVILREPAEFYEVLKEKIANAKHRIYISTLYIGKTEHSLIRVIRSSLHNNPSLTVSILTDAIRGTRESPEPSCASLLVPLIQEFGKARVEVRMWHTPNLTGFRKRVLPKRINEGWGLQHMKLYGVDDDVILSGANLSNDYFTNRQDRYHILRSKALTQYYSNIHAALCSLSFDIQPENPFSNGFCMLWPSSNPAPSPLENPIGYVKNASSLFTPIISAPFGRPDRVTSSELDAWPLPCKSTVIYPLFQLTPLFTPGCPPKTAISPTTSNPSTEVPALTLLLRSLISSPFASSRWTFTAGYFNMTPQTRELLLHSLSLPPSSSPEAAEMTTKTRPFGTILTAHPHANGFFPSMGLSAMLPAGYTHLAGMFLRAAEKVGVAGRVELREWRRGQVGEEGGWTYHAKGLWITLPKKGKNGQAAGHNGGENMENSEGPSISIVGSSNYTYRSATLDTESNALIVTSSPDLRRRLREEQDHLLHYAGERIELDGEFAKKERKVPLKVRLALWVVWLVGGAL